MINFSTIHSSSFPLVNAFILKLYRHVPLSLPQDVKPFIEQTCWVKLMIMIGLWARSLVLVDFKENCLSMNTISYQKQAIRWRRRKKNMYFAAQSRNPLVAHHVLLGSSHSQQSIRFPWEHPRDAIENLSTLDLASLSICGTTLRAWCILGHRCTWVSSSQPFRPCDWIASVTLPYLKNVMESVL